MFIRMSDLIEAQKNLNQALGQPLAFARHHPVRVRFGGENALIADAQRRADAARGRRPRQAEPLALSQGDFLPVIVRDAMRRAAARR